MTPEPENKPVVGDDGELLTDDPTVDPEVYIDSLRDPFPRPSFMERVRYQATNNVWVWVGLLLIIFIIAFLLFPIANTSREPLSNIDLLLGAMVPTIDPLPKLEPTATPRPSWKMPSTVTSSKIATTWDNTLVRWSPDGNNLAYLAHGNYLTFWSIQHNQFTGYKLDSPAQFDWSSDSPYLIINNRPATASSQYPFETRLFMVDRAFLTRAITMPQSPFLDDGPSRLLVTSASNQILLLSNDGLALSLIENDPPQLTLTQSMNDVVQDIDWIGDSGWFSVVNREGIWKQFPNSPRLHPVLMGTYQNVSWSPDGTQFAVTHDTLPNGVHQPTLSIFNAGQSTPQWTTRVPFRTMSAKDNNSFNIQVAWSPFDGAAAFVQGDTVIGVWDTNSGQKIDRMTTDGGILSMDWSPDGKYLAIGSADGVTIWSPES